MYRQLLLATPVVAASALAIYFIRKYKKNAKVKHDTEPVYKALFFKGTMCEHHANKYENCNVSGCFCSNVTSIKNYIKDAKSSLDICLFLLTLKDVVAQIVRAHKRGVKVRVISDAEVSVGKGSRISTLQDSGIEVRLRQTSSMHHAFVIIDNHLLLTGSLNWTMQGVSKNWDSLAITSNSDLVDQFSEEFKWIWNELETLDVEEIMAVP